MTDPTDRAHTLLAEIAELAPMASHYLKETDGDNLEDTLDRIISRAKSVLTMYKKDQL